MYCTFQYHGLQVVRCQQLSNPINLTICSFNKHNTFGPHFEGKFIEQCKLYWPNAATAAGLQSTRHHQFCGVPSWFTKVPHKASRVESRSFTLLGVVHMLRCKGVIISSHGEQHKQTGRYLNTRIDVLGVEARSCPEVHFWNLLRKLHAKISGNNMKIRGNKVRPACWPSR